MWRSARVRARHWRSSKPRRRWPPCRGRDHVIPDDVKYLTPYTLAHRLIVKPEAELRGQTAIKIVGDILERTPLELGN